MKKIIVINYTGRKGGGAVDAFETSKALAEQGANVVPIISKRIENLETWKAFGFEKLIVLETYHNKLSFVLNSLLFCFRQKKQIKKAIKSYDVECVYCPMSTFWTYRINKIFGHSLKIIVNHDPVPHSGANKLSVYLMERPFKKADIVIVHSKKFLDFVTNKYKKVEYFPLGPHNVYKSVPNKKTIVEYNSNKINFVFFGRITAYKGLDLLAKAYKLLSVEHDKSVSLTIVGNGDFKAYESLYKDLPNCKIINRWILDEEVESVFTGNNLVSVCPYKDGTQSGVVLVSYEYGIPVIASRTGGIEEQVFDNKTGFLIEANNLEQLVNSMEKFVNQPTLIKSMQNNISFYLESISWSKSAEHLLNIIRDSKKSLGKTD